MKVLFVGNDKSIITGQNGDAQERMREYAKHFEKLHIIVFCLRKDNLPEVIDKNLKIYPTNSYNRWFYIFDSFNIIRKLNIDLISTQDPFISGLTGVLAKLLFGIKLNIQLHNDFFDNPYFRYENIQNWFFYFLGKFTLLFADSVRVVGQRLVKDHRYFVAPVPVDLDFFKGKRHHKFFNQVVTVSRLAKQKNLPSYFNIAQKLPKTRFVIVGDGEERKSLEKIKPKNVVFVGQKNRKQIRRIFSHSDVFVLTSHYEGWGLACLEALASGLPVVMTDVGCAGEAIIDNMNLEENQQLLRNNFFKIKLTNDFISGLKATV